MTGAPAPSRIPWPSGPISARPRATDAVPAAVQGFLISRAITLAGGTSEVTRDVIAERIPGLPRDVVKQPAGASLDQVT